FTARPTSMLIFIAAILAMELLFSGASGCGAAKGKPDALDHFRHTARPVATRDGQLLHSGRVHSHPAGAGDRGRPDQYHPGQTTCIAVSASWRKPRSSRRCAVPARSTSPRNGDRPQT